MDEIREMHRDKGMLYFETLHLKMLSFLHVVIPRCKRMQLFVAKDPNGLVLYTYINERNRAESPKSEIEVVDQEHHFYGSSLMMIDEPHTKRNHSQNSHSKSRRSGSRNKNIYSSSKRAGAPTLRPLTVNNGQQYTNYQNIAVPSQLDDISSISPNDNTHFMGQDKNSATSHFLAD